ncbi:family 20 glycosylhydrolase [Mucilaginibacter sp. FT3.2]|uniref:family 20 glycosylhydrolase n=1 Tax=Mucilaginibacter sp. FT3.2 TaxID=2723090 RepID=UPI0018541F82|nr:family 20 glycosylhydrolase [Mucilaginibacter sp. FT3.2]MBB6232238.1 hexosaminidase [Mucilaginibacter sp. FT3.2]
MKKALFTIGLMVLASGVSFSQNSNPIVQQVSDVPQIKPGDKKITFPVGLSGYHLVLKGSDFTPIIDSTGRIISPLNTTKVNLYFQLISNNSDTVKYDVSKQIVVPGKYPDNVGNPQPFVIPALREWHGGEGNFALTPLSRIVINAQDKPALQKAAHILQQELKEQSGLSLTTTTGKPKKGDIYLTLHEKDIAIGNEGYYFDVKDFIKISALDYQGVFWGTRTLLQLLEQQKKIPKGIARDYPQFKVRGFILDDGRKFFSLQFLRDYVKFMSYYKMNDFQIHLSDNGFKAFFGNKWDSTYSAFRLQNDTYPGLTAKDGSYTKQEFIALQQLANDYAIRVIPEIDVPAHALAFTKAIPAIGSKLYGMDHLDLHNPLTYTVIENVFKEYLSGPHPVFTGKEVHIGTDEYDKRDAEAFRAFTDHFIKYVQHFGKDVRIWGALTHAKGNTPVTVKNVTLNAWYNGYANPIEMKKLGYNQISTPDGWLYIVPSAGYYYDYLDTKNLYNSWTPSMIGDISFPVGDPTILGGAFAVWNDIVGNGISEKDVHDRVFPAMQVLSQKMWNGSASVMNFDDFEMAGKKISEGPETNVRGKIGHADQSLVAYFSFDKKDERVQLHQAAYANGIKGNALSFSGKNSFANLPYKEIGYDYTVAFWINPSAHNPDNTIIFKSPNSVVKLRQGSTGKLGFSRDGYDCDFDYSVLPDTWTHIVITGTNKGTSLYVNGKLQKKLYDNFIQFTDKDKTKKHKSETLFFPLQRVGGFSGKIDELQIWNKVLPDNEIEDLK